MKIRVPLPAAVGPHPEACDWVSYLRRRSAAGPADSAAADRVLIAQPGIFDGAGAFDGVARNTITQAVGQGAHVEFWALDRRSNCPTRRCASGGCSAAGTPSAASSPATSPPGTSTATRPPPTTRGTTSAPGGSRWTHRSAPAWRAWPRSTTRAVPGRPQGPARPGPQGHPHPCRVPPGHRPTYTWRNYDRIDAPGAPVHKSRDGKPFTTAAQEVTDVQQLARSLGEAPLDFTEWYFPTKLSGDSGKPDAEVTAHSLHPGGINARPVLTVRAGSGVDFGAMDPNHSAPVVAPATTTSTS
ncbi:hypothetical protein L6E12_11970 [Actinokineospora sp. PR83]|uniref:hypothetical protein n=1 Tax=Actinokineospora sp. PR83 TaxID=2884908 RepID=UPI001F3946BA|nr:hypothetical protein [Actinokineospora sp. PR83]MCG8916505.1 hypothetical protein [Actinokineospora sp. PR83]